jgi:phosphoglycolate phosphatase
MVDAVFFDLDGTLADTAPDLSAALNELLDEQGLALLDLATLRPYVSAGARGMLSIGFRVHPNDAGYADLARRFLDLYAARLCRSTRLFDGMSALLDHLDDRNIPWGIVTNKQQRFTLPLIEALGLSGRAAAIISGDSTPNPKPAPDAILLACTTTGVGPEQALYIGDDLRDVQAAHAAGMRAVAAAWGYLGGGPDIADWGAHAVIAKPLDLLHLL